MREINQAGLDLIKSFETCVLHVYNDGYGYPTCGWGHRTDLPLGTLITQAQADAWLVQDLSEAENAVEILVTVALNDNQFAALTSLVFNIGRTNFAGSTLLKDLNAGDFADVPKEEARWDHAGGRVSLGLDRRRTAEIALWNTPIMVVSDPDIAM